jgi:AAA15 family ATPase/GTPase
MANSITHLEINNFKSIEHLEMTCKRINVLIGKPNVGKSNILEALSLYIAPNSSGNKFLEEYIRYERLSNLFYDLDRKKNIIIKSNLGFAALRYFMNSIDLYEYTFATDNSILDEYYTNETEDTIEAKRNLFANIQHSKRSESSNFQASHATLNNNGVFQQQYSATNYALTIKKYHFKTLKEHNNHFSAYLNPPYGDNLFTIIESNPELWNEVAGYFEPYGLEFVVDSEYQKLLIQKKKGRHVNNIPYWLIADTLQRVIFHLAAIVTNKDAVLLFEEPESHSFPPYISHLAEKMIDCKTNQFFIATHSPYLLTPFIEQCPVDDVAIFIASYQQHETKVRALNDAEIENIMETGIDLFFNIAAFQE